MLKEITVVCLRNVDCLFRLHICNEEPKRVGCRDLAAIRNSQVRKIIQWPAGTLTLFNCWVKVRRRKLGNSFISNSFSFS